MDQSATTLFARAPLDPPRPAARPAPALRPRPAPRTIQFEDETAPTLRPAEPGEVEPLPDWLVPVAGGVVAALLGLMLGGALAL